MTPLDYPPGPPRDTPGPPAGQNFAHFVGYLINLPFGTNMGHFFFGIFCIFGTKLAGTKLPICGGSKIPPKNTLFLTPKKGYFRYEKGLEKGQKRPIFGVIFRVKNGPFLTPFWTPKNPPPGPPGGPPRGAPPGGGARGPGGGGGNFRNFPVRAKMCKNCKNRHFRGFRKNPQKWPFLTPTGWRGFPPPHHPPLTPGWDRRFDRADHAALLRHAVRPIGPEPVAGWCDLGAPSEEVIDRHRARTPWRRPKQRDRSMTG